MENMITEIKSAFFLSFLLFASVMLIPSCQQKQKDQVIEVEKAEYFLLRPEIEKAYGYSHAVKIGNDIKISGAVSMDEEGNPTAIGQLANINTPDSKSLIVQPWDKSLLQEIEKGIINANLGFNPMNNGDTVIVSIPPLTEERRKELVKIVRNESENSKIGIRNIRKDSNQEIKKTDISDDEKKNFETTSQLLIAKTETGIELPSSLNIRDIPIFFAISPQRIKLPHNLIRISLLN